MTTSGTIATTTIDTAALVEHAFRRCRVLPSAQTPETVLSARENLYMLLLNLSNRGLNLWAVDKGFMGLIAGQATYDTPAGTLDVLNVVYTQPTLSTTVFAATATGGKSSFTSASVLRIGFKVTTAYTGTLTISTSTDDITYTTNKTLDSATYATGIYHWVDLTGATTAGYVSVEDAAVPAVSDIIVATALSDLPVTIWNRDTYAALNDKSVQGRPSTNYFFEKKVDPKITLWPVPNNSTDHLTIFRHRQAQDVGTLAQTIEIPQRWLDGIIWLLAARLCFELPSVDVALGQMVVQMADKQVFEAEASETDGAPIFITPGIGVYTR